MADQSSILGVSFQGQSLFVSKEKPKHGLSTDKIVDQDVAVNCRRRALDLFNKKDSFLSKHVDPALTTYIATLQSILEKACEVLETRAKLQEEWDLARKVAIKADPLVASTFWVSMHGLSGCCDLHIDHLHQCLLGAALICRIASAYFLSYQTCYYIKLWPARDEGGEALGLSSSTSADLVCRLPLGL